jgi:hypothetical protein
MDMRTRQNFRTDIVALCQEYNEHGAHSEAILWELGLFLGIAVAVHNGYSPAEAHKTCCRLQNHISDTCIKTIVEQELSREHDQGPNQYKGK